MKQLSNRVQNIEESKTVGLASVIAKMRGEGKSIISLNVGEPDFKTPEAIKKATMDAVRDDKTRYSLVPGEKELREAICQKLKKDNQIETSANNILVSNGSKQVLYNVFQSILNPGDEVIIPAPYWVTFPESIKLAGGVPVFVETNKNQLVLENIEKAVTSKTKVILMNSPNNPTGAVYPESDIKAVAKLACDKDLWLISDEAYELLTFDGAKHLSAASISKEVFDRTITVQTFSKSYCMTGFRVGYMVAPEPLIKAVNKLQGHLTGNNCPFAQYGAVAALGMDETIVTDMISTFQKRRDLAYSLFSQKFPCEKPEGAFYLFMDVRKYLGEKFQSCEELAKYILMEAGVALVPGVAFGAPGFMRLSFAESEDNLKRAYEQIAAIL